MLFIAQMQEILDLLPALKEELSNLVKIISLKIHSKLLELQKQEELLIMVELMED